MEGCLTVSNSSMIQSMHTLFCSSDSVKKDTRSFINFILNEHFEWLNIIADLNNMSTDSLIDMIEIAYGG